MFINNIYGINFKINGETDEQITFGEFAQQVVNLASSLNELGVKKGEVVSICSENREEYLITLIATLYAGATVTFINSEYSIRKYSFQKLIV